MEMLKHSRGATERITRQAAAAASAGVGERITKYDTRQAAMVGGEHSYCNRGFLLSDQSSPIRY